MRLVIFTAIRIRRHERAVFELNRRAEAAALRLADWRACVEHQAIVGEVELEAVSGLHCRRLQRPLRYRRGDSQFVP